MFWKWPLSCLLRIHIHPLLLPNYADFINLKIILSSSRVACWICCDAYGMKFFSLNLCCYYGIAGFDDLIQEEPNSKHFTLNPSLFNFLRYWYRVLSTILKIISRYFFKIFIKCKTTFTLKMFVDVHPNYLLESQPEFYAFR